MSQTNSPDSQTKLNVVKICNIKLIHEDIFLKSILKEIKIESEGFDNLKLPEIVQHKAKFYKLLGDLVWDDYIKEYIYIYRECTFMMLD